MNQATDQLCVNTIRMLAVDAIEKAKSGHPGMPMGAAPMAYVLWNKFLRHSPLNPAWPDRDRFVLSAGHGSMLLYALLHLTGYDLPLEELKKFRQWESRTPGHPEFSYTAGVETTTGPLGQGLANAVGMAIAERHLAARFNRPGYDIVDHYTYTIVGDGCLMEGISHEAASLAGTLKLGKLICLYDDNHISIEGSTDIAFGDDSLKRFEAYGWQVLAVKDGNDLTAIEAAIEQAKKDNARPSLIAVRTEIGYGSPGKQGKASAHGEPLGESEVALVKEGFGWPKEPSFYVPDEAARHFQAVAEQNNQQEQAWQKLFASYATGFPELAAEWQRGLEGQLPDNWDQDLPVYPPSAKGMATRAASGEALTAIAGKVPNLIGGSADLAPSTKTYMKGLGDFSAANPAGRNMRFGVREHGMGSVMNGMALHGGLIPFGATFLAFADYMRPPIRLAALMRQKAVYVFTHDSIGLGEDGPTHQPIEQVASLRVIPELTVIRPADANETVEAWRYAMESQEGPVALIFTRQNVPVIDRSRYESHGDLFQGAYIVDKGGVKPDVILMGTGSELHIALEAAAKLKEKGITARVVSMPSWELFDEQPSEYRDMVLPPSIGARIAIEAGSTQGWHKYVGDKGEIVGMDHFGASAPAEILYEKFGITAEHLVNRAVKLCRGK
ncbi:transketolase [Acetonema longum]|uniref:Transketolase n=1 Tax=Acetonema longum DSM 6540 TaxID=1009370 RepID=F7NKI4_9FIRM|nr:transketolase [Acetonema longum]EGO63436.1 transketolase [Acetonema longum DSM 6540]